MNSGLFNTREVASAAWMVVLLVFGLTKHSVRAAIVRLLRAFFQTALLRLTAYSLLYTVAVVVALSLLEFWDATLLKDTVLWYCLGAFGAMMRFGTASQTDGLFRKMVLDTLRATVVVEFLLNTFTFSLLVELVVMPLVTLLGMMVAFGRVSPQYAAATKAAKSLLALAGFALLAHAMIRAVLDYRALLDPHTIEELTVTPILSLAFLPFLYAMMWDFRYENLMLRVNVGAAKETPLRRYARHQVRKYAGLRLARLRLLLKHHAVEILQAQTPADIDRILSDARRRD